MPHVGEQPVKAAQRRFGMGFEYLVTPLQYFMVILQFRLRRDGVRPPLDLCLAAGDDGVQPFECRLKSVTGSVDG